MLVEGRRSTIQPIRASERVKRAGNCNTLARGKRESEELALRQEPSGFIRRGAAA